MPVLNRFEILTALEEYTIAMGSVVDGIALEIEHARTSAIICGIRLRSAPISKVAVIVQVMNADAVLGAAYLRSPIVSNVCCHFIQRKDLD